MKHGMRKTGAALVAAALLLALLGGCAGTGGTASEAPSQEPSALVSAAVEASACTFTFSDGGIAAAGDASGYEISGTDLSITAPGTYTVTGSCGEGSITVKKEVTGVTLVLDGLTLACAKTSPLTCNKSSEVTVRVEGSCALTDNEDIADDGVSDLFEGAAVKVKSGASLTLTGSGTLTVSGNCKNGIKGAASASIAVDGPTLDITAANSALASDGSVTVVSGTVLAAAEDGIKASPDEGDTDSPGTITITGGTFDITAVEDAVKGSGSVTITGGSFRITAGDDAIHSDAILTIGAEGASDGPEIRIAACEEGLEGAEVHLHSGSAGIVSSDDGINAANSDLPGYAFLINITGGQWYVDAGGDGLDSNGAITISGGVTEVCGAENGSDGNTSLDSETGITLTGGTVFTADTGGSALTGTYVSFGGGGGMMGGGFGDRGGMKGTFPGGTGTPPTDERPQDGAYAGGRPQEGTDPAGKGGWAGSAPAGQDGAGGSALSISAGSQLVIRDSAGGEVYSAVAPKSANCVMLAGDLLTEGETYTLYVDGVEAASAAAVTGMAQGGMMGGRTNGPGPAL